MNKLSKKLAKYIFRSHRSLNFCTGMLVFIIMGLTGVLAFCAIGFYRLSGHFPRHFEAPIIMMFITIIVSAIIGAPLAAIASRAVLRPINDIQRAMKRVENGDFSTRANSDDTYGPINDLVTSFNGMVEELDSIEMFREDFINSFSHEFKTPIVSIQGFAKQLKRDNLSDEKRQEYIDIIISESKRLTNLSSNILLLNKFENQQYITDAADYHLDEQIRKCILLLEKSWSKKNIEFDIELEPIVFHSNQEMISQVWLNILSNSIKFSPQNSVIKVVSTVTDDKIRIDFSDSGEGMDQHTLHHIFERFYQADSAHHSEGNGLGLALVKRIVELTGGTIRVESQIGKGTMFSVFFKKPVRQLAVVQSR